VEQTYKVGRRSQEQQHLLPEKLLFSAPTGICIILRGEYEEKEPFVPLLSILSLGERWRDEFFVGIKADFSFLKF
jgi:hypothetical protein